MKRTGRTPDLIRYSSAIGIDENHETIWNTRNIAYSAVLLTLLGFFAYTIFTRPAIETNILRTPGLLFQENADGTISNLYNIKIVNKTHDKHDLEIKILSHDGRIEIAGRKITLNDQDLFQSTLILYIPADQITSENTKVEFGIFEGEKLLETSKATFIYR
jgi:polyferredoxin